MPARPYLALVLLWAAYFHPLVLHPGRVLYSESSDFLAEHLPAKLFLNREWREAGELPRWNPYHFCGSPFIHDVQVGAFYPPYAVTYLVPESALGAALSWVTALHVLAAGVFTYLYARWRGLGELAALVAAVGFMLSAKWMTHLLLAGHTVTVGLAWLPLVLLALERAIRSGGVWPVIGAGVGIALLVLGTHPQWAFYAAVFVALWTLGPALGRSDAGTARKLARWAGLGLAAGAVAAALAAVQWLPTLEAAGQSSRTVGLEQTGTLSVGLSAAVGLVGPSSGYDPPRSWEERGLFGLFALAAAFAAPALAGRPAWWQLGVAVGLVAFSLGGAVLVEWLPGFSVFRLPARMLLVVAFPVAFLAGVATDRLVRGGWDRAGRVALQRGLLTAVLVGVVPAVLFFGTGGPDGPAHPSRPMWGEFVAHAAFVAAALPAAFALTLAGRGGPRLRTGVWVALLAIETVIPTARFVRVWEQERIYPRSALTDELTARAPAGEARATDWHVPGVLNDQTCALGVGAPMALVYRLESPAGYNPLDVRWYREFVWYTLGGRGPVRSLNPVTMPILPNADARRPRLLDVTNLRYAAVPEGQQTFHAGWWRPVAVVPGPPPVPLQAPGAPAELPPHTLYENPTALPRAWVVPEAARMPQGREPEALDGCDFRRTALLTTDDPLPPAAGPVGTARVVEHRPNRVVVRVEGGGGGYLVLSDVWFPGWVCRVDGREVPVYRAYHAFRAAALPAGATAAVFTFEPRSYRVGWWVSCAALIGLAVLALGVGRRRVSTG
jgi:hypothetical protein